MTSIQDDYKYLSRLFRQTDAVMKIRRDADDQLDKLAIEIEQTREMIALKRLDKRLREAIPEIKPLRMEII